MATRDGDPPEISILLLGDAEVGKSTFLSRMTLGSRPTSSGATLPQLHDLEQPFVFDIKLYNRPYRFEFYDTASPTNYTLLKPQVIILCYDITDRASLTSLHTRWKHVVETHFNYDEMLPVVMLGLKRDLRREGVEDMVFPQEAIRIAQEMRCDKYCECSALTGELCKEVFEDVAKTAAMTTTEKGGKSEPPPCTIM